MAQIFVFSLNTCVKTEDLLLLRVGAVEIFIYSFLGAAVNYVSIVH